MDNCILKAMFDEMSDRFQEVGGKLEILADWFFNEKGYTSDEICIAAMFDIAWRDPSLVDLEKFVDCCKQCDKMTDEDKRDYFEDLSRREEINKDILAKLL